MRSLSYETIFAALAALAVGAGCAKKEAPASATPDLPPPSTAAATAAPQAAPVPTTIPADPGPSTAAASAAPSPSPVVGRTTVVDAGTETKKPAKENGANASCGAGGCSDDMKKKNH